MTDGLSVDEKCAVNDYRRVSYEASEESAGLSLAACALKALAGGISAETQEEMFTLIRKEQGITEPLDRAGRLAMLHTLGQAQDVVVAYGERAAAMATGAEETAQQVELQGLPASSE